MQLHLAGVPFFVLSAEADEIFVDEEAIAQAANDDSARHDGHALEVVVGRIGVVGAEVGQTAVGAERGSGVAGDFDYSSCFVGQRAMPSHGAPARDVELAIVVAVSEDVAAAPIVGCGAVAGVVGVALGIADGNGGGTRKLMEATGLVEIGSGTRRGSKVGVVDHLVFAARDGQVGRSAEVINAVATVG